MQVKTTVRYHLILVRIAIIKNTIDKKCRQKKKCGGKRNPLWAIGKKVNWSSHFGKECEVTFKN